MEAMKKQFELEGLCCGNCAAKIEQEVGGLEGVAAANVDFATKTMTVELSDDTAGSFAQQAQAIASRHDSDIVLREKELPQEGKKVLYLLGLDCADCAKKIETAVSQIDGVQAVSLDFTTQRLSITTKEKNKLPVLTRRAVEIVKEIEPEVEVSFTGKAEEKEEKEIRKERIRRIGFGAGAVLFVLGMVLELPQPVEFSLYLVSYLLVGGEVLWKALRNICRGEVFDENFLMSVATVGAFAIGDFPEGVAVMLFYQVGEFFQAMAVNRSRKSISALMDIRPDSANLKLGDEVRKVSPEEVAVGDLILVRPGERIPLDGKVTEGRSSLDTSALTGESLPRDVEPGAEVLSGTVNRSGLLTVEVTKEFGQSTVNKILDLVQNASSQKAQTENFITKFARYYTPAVVFSALALAVIPPLVLPGASFSDWITRALTFLVVSCPCALVISIPLSFFGGIGGASKSGILVKGSNYLEALNNVDTVVFDKTGTLTKGNFKMTQINAAEGWSREALLETAAHAELYSSHPIAASIREAYGKEPDAARVADYEEISGHGVRVRVDGKTVLAGNSKLMESENIRWQPCESAGTVVYLAADGRFAGSLVISDEVKPDSKAAILGLKAAGVRQTVMLTGDSRATGETVARELGLDAVYSELLPQQKVEKMEELAGAAAAGGKSGKIIFVGDGINDAPVLARADVGVAMGGLGSDAAIEAADVVLMTDEPFKLVTAIQVAKKTRSIVWQNIIFALGVKAVILVLAAFGIASMWEAVFGDVGVALIAILNAMRVIRYRPKK